MKKRIYPLLPIFLGILLMLFSFSGIQAQNKTIKGSVTSEEDGLGLPGVTVLIKGSSVGTVTDGTGNFTIDVPSAESILVFSFIGYLSKEVSVSSQETISVALEIDLTNLEEVVVVGYGTQKKVNLTGAVESVGSDRLENRPIVSTGGGLQGVIPGLNVTIPSGDPTRGADFNIRGFESINGGAPLILVDNVPMDINRINPEDIKSVTVLKDGAAAAIYGARAAFGVILVETKQGKKGIDVRIGTQLTWDKPIWYVEPIKNGYDFAVLRNAAITRSGGQAYYPDEYLGRLKNYWDDPSNNDPYAVVDGMFEQYGYEGVNDELLSSFSPRQKYDLSISGASDRATYYSSFGFLNTNGYLNHPGNDTFKRYNILLKGDYKITDWFSISQGVTLNIQKSDRASQADVNTLIRAEPIRPWIVPKLQGYQQFEGMYWDNPFTLLADLDVGGRETFSNSDIWLSSGITLSPFQGFVVKSNFSYNIFNQNLQSARLPFEMISANLDQANPRLIYGDDEISVNSQYNQYYVWNSYAEYTKEDWTDHYLKGMVGFNQEWDYNTFVSGGSGIFINPGIVDIGATSGLQTITGGKTQAALRGAFYRLNYIYKDKYLFETNGRYDGTSRFPEDDRYGFFPSFSAGWRVSNESFMENAASFLDNLKIRASYGSLGNQLGNNFYPYIPSMASGFSEVLLGSGLTPYINPPGLVSPTLTWEKVITQNLGIDVAFFAGRLESSFDIYTRDTKDMLLRREYPPELGTNPPLENGADLRTKGWEFSLKWKGNASNDFRYYLDFNLADWTAEITKYDNPTGALSEYYVGQTIGEIWGYRTVGIIQNEEQLANLPDQTRLGNNWMVGDIEFADLDGDGIITQGENTVANPGDQEIIGNTSPRYSFGMNMGASYKSFSINIFFQGVGSRDFMPARSDWTWFYPWRSQNGDLSWIDNSWTPENPDAYFPAQDVSPKNFPPQTRYLQNASYLRLKNLNISYDLPVAFTEKIGLSGVKFYVGGQNLFEFSKIRKPLDPEYIFDSSIDYPLFRSFTAGFNINL